MVRIVFPGGRNKGAIASLLAAVVAGASVWAGYWVWHRDGQVVAVQRRLQDFTLNWRCPKGHVFPHSGAYGSIPCPTCGAPAQVVITYECPAHGRFEALVMFDKTTDRPAAVQFEPGKWINVSTVIPCPRCGHEMHPTKRSPFDRVGTTSKEQPGHPPP